MASLLQEALRPLDTEVQVEAVPLAQVRWRLAAAERFRSVLVATFAIVATFLALVGIFGVVSYGIRIRTQEIGVRMALGPTDARSRRK